MPRVAAPRVHAVRHFNRFYTRQLGLLDRHLHATPFALTEARILYEIAQHADSTAGELGKRLGLDKGQLSRTLDALKRRHPVVARTSATDKRRQHLSLTDAGQAAFASLDAAARTDVGERLARLRPADQDALVASMRTIERLLGGDPPSPAPVTFRGHQPGDLGWVVERHAAYYCTGLGWDQSFEGLVASIVAHYIEHFDPARERAWFAERDGERLGFVFLVRKTDEVAQLRMLLVEEHARGLGLGRQLVERCIAFAREAGYRSITLWTNHELDAARHIYAATGFVHTHTETYQAYGTNFISETWDLALGAAL